ncbi:hypothetical protein MMC13_007529 [Lambiella insularis]|nr:hypothetical protein [Lambiella insularis]
MQKTLHSGTSAEKARSVYILVMGLTGAGKSTFISVVTGDPDIPIGEAGELDGVTQQVQEYILLYRHENVPYEIHLIDSPGFDDGNLYDADVLSRIADYTSWRIVPSRHDQSQVGRAGQRNLRMMEEMLGPEKWANCTLVTTKWGCTDIRDQEKRETTLREDKNYFGAMLQNEQQAKMMRFDPKTKGTALQIIRPYLGNKFVPHLSEQMVDPKGPKLPLGETQAGKIVADNLEKLQQTQQELDKVQIAKHLLSQRKEKTAEAQNQLATIRTLDYADGDRPGASAFALAPAFETAVRGQRTKEKQDKRSLESEFVKKAAHADQLKQVDPRWLWNSNVKSLQDFDESYSLKSPSSETLSSTLQHKAIDRITAPEGSEGPLELAQFGKSEMDEFSGSSDDDTMLM